MAATAAYLLQDGQFVFGPRAKLSGGLIEARPLDYIVRTNAILTLGGEAGVAMGRWYIYGFGAGGAAWLSAEKLGIGRTNNMVPAYEVGGGIRYKLPKHWYAKAEIVYVTLGDQRLAGKYFDPKPFLAFVSGFGIQFASKPPNTQNQTSGSNFPSRWAGLSADLGLFRPLNSHVVIDHSNNGAPVGTFNLTGIHVAATAAYLFQDGQFVFGPRAKLSGGLIEAMPLDYTVRTNAILTLGGEAGVAMGRWYI